MRGIIGKKLGMTRIVADNGDMIAVTVLHTPPSEVLQVRKKEVDGCDAIVLGSFKNNSKSNNKNQQFKVIEQVELAMKTDTEPGNTFGIDTFADRKEVKITGITKGRGFAGVVKRWGFRMGPNSHGSVHHRQPGSSGQCAKPGRILRGKKFPGHYGAEQMSLRNVKIMKIDTENNLLVVKGSIPGANSNYVFIQG